MSLVYLGIDIGIRNFSFCKIRASASKVEILQWENIDCIKLTDCPKKSLASIKSKEFFDLCAYGLSKIELLFDNFSDVTHVLIENQPLGKYQNPKTLCVQNLLYSYFRNKLNSPTTTSALRSVQLVAASTKYKSKFLAAFSMEKVSNYDRRKMLSINLANQLITKWKVTGAAKFDLCREKKDDLADSFLLAAAFIHECNPSLL